MVYVLYAGFAGRSDRRAGIAAAVVAAETLIFAGNGSRCPLTQVAGRLGAERGSVTDIYLRRWFARNLPAIHVPLIGLAGFLHARNLRTRRRAGRHAAGMFTAPEAADPPSRIGGVYLLALSCCRRPQSRPFRTFSGS
jgi:hypothetical protein